MFQALLITSNKSGLDVHTFKNLNGLGLLSNLETKELSTEHDQTDVALSELHGLPKL